MTSIRCPDCSTEVPSSELSCPKCNFPISKLRGLSSAILTKNAARVASLIQLGSDVNGVDKNGRTPLMIAALLGDVEIVQMLIAAGARPEFVNDAGENALLLAKSREVEKIIRRAIVVSRFQKSASATAAPAIQPPEPVTSGVHVEKEQEKCEQHEPVITFDNSSIFVDSSDVIRIAPSNETSPIDLQLNEELFESSQEVYAEPMPPALDFGQSLKFTDVAAWENRRFERAEFQKPEFIEAEIAEESSIQQERALEFPHSPEAEQSNSEIIFEDTLPWQFDEPQNLEPPERKSGNGYFIGALIWLCLLLLFMALTWPRSPKQSIPQSTQAPEPATQIKESLPEEYQPVQKLVVLEQNNVIHPVQEPDVKDITPASSSKHKSRVVMQRASMNRATQKVSDEEKNRLGRALNDQGFSLMKIGRHGQAIPLLEQSVRSFPRGTKDVHYAYALFNLGVAWRKAGRPDLAIPILEKRIMIDNQREAVARELNAAKKEAKAAGFDSLQKKSD